MHRICFLPSLSLLSSHTISYNPIHSYLTPKAKVIKAPNFLDFFAFLKRQIAMVGDVTLWKSRESIDKQFVQDQNWSFCTLYSGEPNWRVSSQSHATYFWGISAKKQVVCVPLTSQGRLSLANHKIWNRKLADVKTYLIPSFQLIRKANQKPHYGWIGLMDQNPAELKQGWIFLKISFK